MDNIDVVRPEAAEFTEDPAANEISLNSNDTLHYKQDYRLQLPKARQKVVLDAFYVKKIYSLCKNASKRTFPWAELFLSASSLLLGAFLGALISNVPYEMSFVSILSYNICPAAGVGFGVAYLFCRKKDVADVKQLAVQIEEYICDDIEINETQLQKDQ